MPEWVEVHLGIMNSTMKNTCIPLPFTMAINASLSPYSLKRVKSSDRKNILYLATARYKNGAKFRTEIEDLAHLPGKLMAGGGGV